MSADWVTRAQVMSFLEWRVALWHVLHGTHRTMPFPQSHSRTGSFQEEAFVFTWLQLQKAIDRLVAALAGQGRHVDGAPELQRLRGIGEQVRCCKLLVHVDQPEEEVWQFPLLHVAVLLFLLLHDQLL